MLEEEVEHLINDDQKAYFTTIARNIKKCSTVRSHIETYISKLMLIRYSIYPSIHRLASLEIDLLKVSVVSK